MKRISSPTTILGVGLLIIKTCLAVPACAQRSGWTAYWENDKFAFHDGSDRNYTNGLRLVWNAQSDGVNTKRGWFEDLWGQLPLAGLRPRTASAFTLGQNFFTPSTITVYETDPEDRPFVGVAYGGFRVDATERGGEDGADSSWASGFRHIRQQSMEFNVGVLGATSGARTIQTLAHILREHRVPKGWKNQLPHEPFLSAHASWRLRLGWHFLDLTPDVGLLVGTAQSYFYGAATARLGWNMSGFPIQLVRNTAVPESRRAAWDIALVVGAEGRAMGNNAFVRGGLRKDSRGVPAEHLVGDYRLGFSFRLTDWRMTWLHVRRSPDMSNEEVRYRRYHNYGSLSFAYEPSAAPAREGTLVRHLHDWLGCVFGGLMLEVATGLAHANGVSGMLSSRLSLSKRIGLHFAFGGEIVGTVRDYGPPPSPGGDHEDLFSVNKLLTARWMPFDTLGSGRLHLRVGFGRSLQKRQVTPGKPGRRAAADPCPVGATLESSEFRYCNSRTTGTGLMLGLGYWFPMPGKEVSLGIDFTCNTMLLKQPLGAESFPAVTFGFQWHP